MVKDEAEILELLIRHELAIKQLYEVFATMLTSHKLFWQNIAADEQRHADLLAKLRPNKNAGDWLQRESRLKPQAIKTSLVYIESQIAKAKQGDINLPQALSIAKDLESALIERHFSRMKPSAPKEIGLVLMILADETAEHLKTVTEKMDSEADSEGH